jgi:polysaccharide pyruvyl transferase WcaK-like protein
MYLILHAFSRRNAGDGLLVDLTLEALQAAGVNKEDCVVLALDPESFSDLDHVERAPGEPRAVPSFRLLESVGELTASLTGKGRVASLVSEANGLIAVGGGYLVADSAVRQAGVLLNHYAQLRAAARSKAPSVYLPQSIGPLHGPVGRMVRRELRGLDRLYVRDDQTLSELEGPNVRRCADLAVMKLARSLPEGGAHGNVGPAVIVARDLPNSGTYERRLQQLQSAMQHPRWAVQADIQGPRSDRAFYNRLGIEDSGSLSSVLRGSKPSAIVSVRLHGAIAALLAGVPAIHLAYERKGWGAYEDLGLNKYVHDARTFDPALVARQVEELSMDPAPVWTLLHASREELNAQYDALVGDLRNLLRA